MGRAHVASVIAVLSRENVFSHITANLCTSNELTQLGTVYILLFMYNQDWRDIGDIQHYIS